jgi:hypothetical protein
MAMPSPSSMTMPLRAGRRRESEKSRYRHRTDQRSAKFHKNFSLRF